MEAYDIIGKYEKISSITCEKCGSNDAKICQSVAWVYVSCEACNKKSQSH